MLLQWPIQLNKQELDLPNRVITFAPGQSLSKLPLEVGILLPTVAGNRVVLQALQNTHNSHEQTAIGLFAADHFLNLDIFLPKLQRANVQWVCNLPALAQHESDFQHYLSEVELTLDYEVKQLAQCRDAGFKTLLIVSERVAPALITKLQPNAIVIVPNVSEFTAGFPKLEQRERVEAELKKELVESGYQGPVLSYREQSEETIFPCLCRPFVIKQIDSTQT